MKKIVILLGLLYISTLSANATCDYKCVAPYDKNSAFNAFFSKITGANKATEKGAEIALKKAIEKKIHSDKLTIDIDSFSSRDLKNGIFKAGHVEGKNVSVNNIYASYIDLKTLCNFNYIQYSEKTKDVFFKEDFPFSFEVKMSSDDLNKNISIKKYKEFVEKLNQYCGHIPGLEITNAKIGVKSSKLVYTIYYKLPLVKSEQHMSISSDVYIKDGKIKLKNSKLLSNLLKLDASKIISLLSPVNPLDFSIHVDEKEAKINVDTVDLKGNMVDVKGIAIIPKDEAK